MRHERWRSLYTLGLPQTHFRFLIKVLGGGDSQAFFFHSLYFPDGKSVYKLKPVTQIVAEENVLKKNQISLCKIALYAIAVSKRFHLNSYTIGFHPQMS